MMRHILLAAVVALSTFVSSVHSAQLYHREGSLDLTAARPTSPNTWTATSLADPTANHSVLIALHFQNRDHIEQLFNEMHDPTHPSWLNHLTREQIHNIIAPPQETTDRLMRWMSEERGVPAEHITYLIGANAIRVDSSVAHINRLFNTTLHSFTHTDGRTAVRQLGASYVPDEFVSLIHIVDGLAMMPYNMHRHGLLREFDARRQPAPTKADNRHAAAAVNGPSVSAPDQNAVFPLVPANSLYGMYNMSDMSSQTYASNPITSTTTIQFYTSDSSGKLQANSFSPSDLQKYSSLWSKSARSDALKVWTIRGPNDASNPTGEPTLDVQSITSLNPVAANQFELTASGKQQYWWASDFVSRDNIAQVVSISYGIDEAIFLTTQSDVANSGQDGILLKNYLSATNNLFMLIGARGTTILASSGDDGAQGIWARTPLAKTGTCSYTTDPYYPTSPHGPTAEFPAISPYVTAVGGTEIVAPSSAYVAQLSGSTSPMCSGLTNAKLAQLSIDPPSGYSSYRCLDASRATGEQAVSIEDSGYNGGGGFSRYFGRSSQAKWQDSAVNTFLSSNATKPSAQYFNSTGRAIPDVAMYGALFPLVQDGEVNAAAGTSLSCPLFAAVIALLNMRTLQAKNRTIGFANPLLYAMAAQSPSTFRDITVGSNFCPSTDTECPHSACQGYTATTGWDAVTGLGVPNVAAMQSALSQYLSYANGNGTGSVTGISGAAGGASVSVWLSMLLVVVVSMLGAMVM